MIVYGAFVLSMVAFVVYVICGAWVRSKRMEELYINDYDYQKEMKILTEEQQKKLVKEILDQAEETQTLLMALHENEILSIRDFGSAMSRLASKTTNLANEIYGMKGVIMCNEKFGIGGK